MADYTTITDAQVDPEAPITSELMSALRDNPIAIAEGAVGAPRIRTTALQGPVAGTDHLIMRLQEDATAIEAVSSFPGVGLNNRASLASHLGVTCLVPGTITAYFEHRVGSGGSAAVARILKNGSQVASWSTFSFTFVARSVNISVEVGDVIIFQQHTGGSGNTAEWRFLRIYSNNPDFAVA
jgi:hypothetical protein